MIAVLVFAGVVLPMVIGIGLEVWLSAGGDR